MTASASQLLQNLPHATLAALVKRAGFRVESVLLDEGSAYLWAKAPDGEDEPVQLSIWESSENFQIRTA